MPNHCHNDLYIHGDKERIAALLKLVGSDQEPPKFDCNAIVPYPARFADMDAESAALGYQGFRDKYGPDAKDGFNSGGYEWRVENWGTKWGAYEVERRDYEGVCITFQTAWGPPLPIVVALHRLFPTLQLSLEYFEMGQAFSGGVTFDRTEDDGSPGVVSRSWRGQYQGTRGG